MGRELISRILQVAQAPEINRVRAGSKVAEALLENLFQNIVESNGRGVTDRFTNDADVNSNAQIFVNRILPVKMEPREQGASLNGGSFSSHSHFTQTRTVGIELLTTIDDTIVIPGSRQRMIKTDLLAEQVSIFSDRLNTIVNGATAASKLLTSWVADVKGEEIHAVDVSATDIATPHNVLERFIEANSLLDEGDEANGIDIFPEDTRIGVFKVSARPVLKASGVLMLGGSNYAQQILASNALSQGATARVIEDGYIGDIDGIPCHLISNGSLLHADGFLGLPRGYLKASPFFGYIASSYANARGVSTVDRVKIIDAIEGQGVILQPFVKLGVASWYAKGNVLITKEATDGVFNPYKELKSEFSTEYSTGLFSFKLKAAGSRLYPKIAVTASSGTGFTATYKALDDAEVDRAVKAIYRISTAATGKLTKISDFAGAGAGAFTSGTPVTVTIASGAWINILAIADDGSVSIHNELRAA